MVSAKRVMPARVVGTDGTGGVSIFLFLNGAGEVYHVHGNIGQSQSELVVEQLKKYKRSSMMTLVQILVLLLSSIIPNGITKPC